MLKSKIDEKLRVTLPFHNKDLKRKTIISILKQANLDISVLKKIIKSSFSNHKTSKIK